MSNQTRREDQPALWGDSSPSSMSESGPQPRRPAAAPRPSRTRSAPLLPTQRPSKPMDYSELWTIDDVANYLGVPKQTIYSWRHTGYGPKGFRVGKHLRWRSAVVIAWTLGLEKDE
jgi:excisionase family DNA binding protein